MANFILLCAHISVVLTVVDTAVLSVTNKQKDEVSPTDNTNYSGKTETYFNKSKRHANTIDCSTGSESLKHRNTIQTNNSCSDKQRSKTAAVLISIYFGIFGVDWFYLSRGSVQYIFIGICKLLVSCACCSGWPFLTLGSRRISGGLINIGYILSTIFSLMSLFWWIIDWTRILANKFPDGNGKELQHFSEYF